MHKYHWMIKNVFKIEIHEGEDDLKHNKYKKYELCGEIAINKGI